MREYWIVDLEKECIEVLSNRAERYELLGIFFKEDTLSTSLLPDLNLAVSSIFAE